MWVNHFEDLPPYLDQSLASSESEFIADCKGLNLNARFEESSSFNLWLSVFIEVEKMGFLD